MNDAREQIYLQQAAEQYASNLRQTVTNQLKIRELNEEIDMLRLQVQDLQTQVERNNQHTQESHPDDVA
jgi:hypothetical protein